MAQVERENLEISQYFLGIMPKFRHTLKPLETPRNNPEWCPVGELNSCPSLERAVS